MTAVATSSGATLSVEDLTVEYQTSSGAVRAVTDVSLTVGEGEAVGLVGESGSGKTSTALGIAGLLPPNARRKSGRIVLRGTPLPVDEEKAMRPFRWREVAVVFQGAMNSLNPVHRIGDQIAEPLIRRMAWPRSRANARAAELLERVGIPAARAQSYPHELSGGMRQRVMIAMALACEPALLIGDEPTTALDVVTQAQILVLLRDLRRQFELSLLLISHDLSVVAEACDRVVIMYAGRVVEEAPTDSIFSAPQHPYTRLLIESVPDPSSAIRIIKGIPGSPPDMRQAPTGCPFHPRCPQAMDICRTTVPSFLNVERSMVACHLYDEFPQSASFAAEDRRA